MTKNSALLNDERRARLSSPFVFLICSIIERAAYMPQPQLAAGAPQLSQVVPQLSQAGAQLA